MRDVRSLVRDGAAAVARVYRGTRPYGPFAILFALIVVSLAVYSVPSLYMKAIEEWRMKLSAMADDRKTSIELFIDERKSDGGVVASFPVIRRIAAASSAGLPPAEADRGHARSLLAMIRDTYGYLSLHVVDAQGRTVVGSDADHPLIPECSDQIRDFFAGGHNARIHFHPHDENGVLAVLTPIELPGDSTDVRSVCGALMAHINLGKNLYALLAKRPFPSRTIESLLVRRQGERLVFLSPLRHLDISPMSHSVPFDTPDLAGSHAARGGERFGSFVDYRGIGVYAVTRPIAGTDAGLVVKVDRLEALAGFFRELAYLSVAVLGLLASAAGIGYAFVRRQRIAHLEELSRRDTRFRLLMEQANDIVLFVSMDGAILDANEQAVAAYGYSIDELKALRIADLRSSDSQNHLSVQMQTAFEKGIVFETEHRKKDGTGFPVEVSSRGVLVGKERILLSIIRDIGERKEAERRIVHSQRLYAVLSQSNQTIVRVDNGEDLFDRICGVAVDYGGFRLAWIGVVDRGAGSVVPVASEGDEGAYLSVIQVPLNEDVSSAGPSARAIHEGAPVVCNDIVGDPMYAPWRDAAMARGYRSMGSFPIRSSGTVTHVLNVYSDEANFFTGEEIRLLSEITDDISFALESLERKELQRTAEAALRESETRFKLLIESAPEGIFVQTHLHFAYVNSTAVRFFGALSENDLIGTPVMDRFDPRFRDIVRDRIHRLNIDRMSVPMIEQVYLKMDGTPFPVEVAAVPIHWKGEDGALVFFRDITERKLADEEHRRNQEWLQLYFDLPFIGMAVTSPRTKQWLRVNDRLCEILGYPREELTLKSWADLTHPDDLDADVAEFEKVMHGESEGYKMDKRFIRGDGAIIYATIDVKCVRTDRGEVDFFVATIQDITDRVIAAKELEESEARYRLVSENGSDVIWLYDLASNRFSYVSPSVERLRGFAVEEVLSQSMSEALTDESYSLIERQFPRRLAAFASGDESARIQTHEVDQIRRDGGVVPTEVVTTLIVDDDGRVTHIQGVTRDISERKRSEFLLREKDTLLREMSEVAHIGGWEFDPATGRGTWTDEVARIHDLEPAVETSAETGLGFFHGEHRTAIENALRAAVEEGVPYDLELELVTAKGVRKWVRTVGLADKKDGKVKRIHGTMQDITERKIIDEHLRASLREKEVLLKEIHHRVKNNMQVIISLLSLQSRNIQNEGFRRVFNDSVTRIHSMALVHEKLYRSGNFARINFKEYLESLIDIISRSYSLDGGHITLSAFVPPVEWGVDTAIPCGLIVSEAITNAVKHAFPGNTGGEIRVSLAEERADGDGKIYYMLDISDNGVGMPEEACFDSAESLGMLLINQLVQQLEGTVEIVRSPGSTVRIRFLREAGGE